MVSLEHVFARSPSLATATRGKRSPLARPRVRTGAAFMAGLARHPSAEPDTLVVRAGFEERDLLIEDAPETYYVTDYYRPHPVVLARVSRLDRDALRDLLSVSWRLTAEKVRKRGRAC